MHSTREIKNMNFIFGQLALEITSTMCAAPRELKVETKLFEISNAHYNTMSFPYNLLTTARQKFDYYTLSHTYQGFKYTEHAIMAMNLDAGFNLFLNDHGEDKKSFENIMTSTKNLSKTICIFTNLNHGSNIEHSDMYYWQNKTNGQNGAAQKVKISSNQTKLYKIWQNYYEEFNLIKDMLTKPNQNTGDFKSELVKYEKTILDEYFKLIVLLYPDEKKSIVTYRNSKGRYMKTGTKNWEKFIPYNKLGLTEPSHAIKINFTGDITV
jgi:hypothetical protein